MNQKVKMMNVIKNECLVYLLTCNKCKMQYLWPTVEQFRSRWNNYKSDSRKHGQATCLQQHMLNHFWLLQFLKGCLINLYR